MRSEIWKDVNSEYEVSNFGHIKSKERIIIRSGSHGYLMVTLYKKGLQTTQNIHTLVAKAFIGKCPKNQEVRHKDGNKLNNHAKNLEYGTRTQNLLDCRVHGSRRFKPVERSDGKTYMSAIHTIKDGFSPQAVRHCCRGRNLTSGGFSWKYI